MLTHKGTQTICTKRLVLRRFAVEDAQAMYSNWASDSRVTRFLTWLPHTSAGATAQLLALWCKEYENAAYYNWVITMDGVPIGNISVVAMSEKNGHAELGYSLGHAYWGRGIMTEAAHAVIAFLFTEVGVNRVGISHAVGNPASGRVAQKCGLTLEGIRREYYKVGSGELLDLCLYGITRSAWQAQQQ